MDFEQIFETAKQGMMEDLEGLTLNNFLEKKELIYAHIHFMESIQELRESKMRCSQNNLDMHDESAVPSDINPPNAEQTREASLESQEGERKMYLFKRSVLGGYLPELNAIVPEGIVRKLGLENHDYVYATEVPNSNPEKKKYVYELAKKAEHPIPCDRVQYNYCPIEMDGSIMVVRRSLEIDDEIRIGEIPYSVRIPDEDIIRLNLKEGDIVDIAFPTGKPEKCRVLFVHPVEELESQELHTTKNSKKKSKERETKEREIPQTLEGKTILVIGNEPYKAYYRDNIESRGGVFLWADAKDSFITLEANVRKANIVIFLLGVSGHIGMKMIKKLCKDYGIPFIPTWESSTVSVVRLAEEALAV